MPGGYWNYHQKVLSKCISFLVLSSLHLSSELTASNFLRSDTCRNSLFSLSREKRKKPAPLLRSRILGSHLEKSEASYLCRPRCGRVDEFKDRHRGRGYFGGERRTSKQSERIVFPKVHNEKERGRARRSEGRTKGTKRRKIPRRR